jgi:hypothetical protein
MSTLAPPVASRVSITRIGIESCDAGSRHGSKIKVEVDCDKAHGQKSDKDQWAKG